MIENLPNYIAVIFGLTTIATLVLFYWAVRNSKAEAVRKSANSILTGLICWLAIQAIMTLKNVYNTHTLSLPPKIGVFGILPPILTILFLFSTAKGKRFVDSLSLANITYINLVRIPVELFYFGCS